MKKLAAMSFDTLDIVISGNLNELATLTKGKDELVKNAHVPTIDEVNKMPNDNFALIIYDDSFGFMKKLATTDKYITELNMDVFKSRVNNFPDEIIKVASTFLKKAAKFYHLVLPDELSRYVDDSITSNIINTDSIDKLAWANKQQSFEKIAEDPNSYALPSKKKYPLSSPELVKKATAYFTKHYSEFSPKERFEFGVNTKLAATSFNIDVVTSLNKYGELVGKLNPNFTTHINTRKFYVSDEDKSKYDALDASNGLAKLASALELLDAELGLDKLWTRAIEDPYLSVYATKIADTSYCEHAGKKITSEKLASVDLNFLDEDTIKDLRSEEGIAVFESLPKPLKDKITQLL